MNADYITSLIAEKYGDELEKIALECNNEVQTIADVFNSFIYENEYDSLPEDSVAKIIVGEALEIIDWEEMAESFIKPEVEEEDEEEESFVEDLEEPQE